MSWCGTTKETKVGECRVVGQNEYHKGYGQFSGYDYDPSIFQLHVSHVIQVMCEFLSELN